MIITALALVVENDALFYLTVFLLAVALVVWQICFNRKSPSVTTQSLLLFSDGRCQFAHQPCFALTKNSRVGLCGYWLVFEKNTVKNTRQFIFKDSLSAQDNAILARTIIRLRA